MGTSVREHGVCSLFCLLNELSGKASLNVCEIDVRLWLEETNGDLNEQEENIWENMSNHDKASVQTRNIHILYIFPLSLDHSEALLFRSFHFVVQLFKVKNQRARLKMTAN